MFSSPLTSFPFIFAILGASTAASTTHTANVARGVESSSDICLVSKPIRCLPSRGLRNLEAGTAVNSLAYGRVPMEGFNIEAGTCIHHITGYTCAQICNYTPEDRVVSQKEGMFFDNLSAYIYGIGGADDVDPETAEKDVFTGEINMVKRAVVTDSKFKNGVLSITVDQSPKSRAEVEALGRNFDPCDHDNGFTGESIWGCNKRPPNKDGSCDFRYKNNNRDCAAWCEVRRRYFHGLERPYNVETINRGPGASMVTLTKGTSTSWGVSYGLNLGLADPLSRFSGGLGFSIEKSCTHSLDESFAPQYSEMGDWCGYWTLIPKMVESCGSMTKWHTTTLVGPNGATSPMCDASQPSRTFGNQCITYPYRKDRNRVDGNTVVVLVDCKMTNILAPMRRQNQYYRKPGVADTQSGRLKKAPGDKK
ncbi:hypothetical protein TWF788_005447 [Orbilia oligospora]|uniref:Uncharacterized protein n=1 Tax=Orbilia oligospora TaxID=2813651 RepID=A0A7C8PYT7_ORBOL|nr:hypothetical protein TWF788_005447 [Orbilia oligospora]